MKIALINPPDENRIYTEVPAGVNQKTGVLPPLGLLYIEASVSKYTRHEVRLMDFPANGLGYDDLKNFLHDFSPDIIGITGHTQNLFDMLKASETFKNINPSGIVVWGGAHASAFPSQSLSFSVVDYVISGEGERAFLDLIDFIENKKGSADKISGLVHRNDEGKIIKNKIEIMPIIDDLPHPQRKNLDPEKYYQTAGSILKSSSFISSRGCPYRCSFCSTPGNAFRARSAGDVVDEIEECVNLGIQDIYFVDDTFNVDSGRVEEICAGILKRKIKFSWNFRGRIDLLTKRQIEISKKAGCKRIQLGVETGSDEGLQRLKKGITTDQVKKVFGWIKESGITSMAYFMIGCPHEKSREDVLKTIDFACQIDPDFALFGIMTPYPGTEIYNEGVSRGIIDPSIWESFVTNPKPDFMPPLWSEFLNRDDLKNLLDAAYKKFYGRPGYMLKRLREIRSPEELWRKIKIGLKILG